MRGDVEAAICEKLGNRSRSPDAPGHDSLGWYNPKNTPSMEPATLGHACRFPTLATDDAAALAALAALWARHPATVVPSLTTDGTTHLIDLRPGTHPPYIRHHLMHTGTGNAHATANPQSRCRFTQKKAPHTPLC